MKKLRILLYPVAVVAEMLALVACFVFSFVNRKLALRGIDRAGRFFPRDSWYIGR